MGTTANNVGVLLHTANQDHPHAYRRGGTRAGLGHARVRWEHQRDEVSAMNQINNDQPNEAVSDAEAMEARLTAFVPR